MKTLENQIYDIEKKISDLTNDIVIQYNKITKLGLTVDVQEKQLTDTLVKVGGMMIANGINNTRFRLVANKVSKLEKLVFILRIAGVCIGIGFIIIGIIIAVVI